MNFYICRHCKNVVAYVENKGPHIVCCGEEMQLIIPNTTDAAKEKHVPVIEVHGTQVIVTIGSEPHPMTEPHHIAWIALETKDGNQRKCLEMTGAPRAEFAITEEDTILAAYEYCNLHGLWKAEMTL